MGKRFETVTDHVTDITISTATVDIQVMRIGTKQMTLAVFRQLPEKDIFDRSGNLLAPAWGWVNYDCEGPAKPFVFSYEGILYRDKISLDGHDHLTVHAEIEEQRHPQNSDGWEWNSPKSAWTRPTGKWVIEEIRGEYYSRIWYRFASEKSAREYFANRLIGVALLKHAPQLFIGV